MTLIYCDFSPLSPEKVDMLLKNVHSLLDEGGYFFFDVHNYHLFDSIKEEVKTYTETDGFYMPGGAEITVKTIKYEDEKVFLNHIIAESEIVQLDQVLFKGRNPGHSEGTWVRSC